MRLRLAWLALATALPVAAATPGPTPEVEFVDAFPALRFERPLFVTPVPGAAQLAVVTQPGVIYTIAARDDAATREVLLDLRGQVIDGGEKGLLGLAFHPRYPRAPYLFVDYVAPRPLRSVIARYTVVAGRADPASAVTLLEVAQPYANHNGGMLAFGPDGMLYAASGDGGSAGDPHDHGQRLDTLLGKILRLDPRPGAPPPPDNPFVGVPGARPEVWAYGLRNPWRFSFDRATGALWAGDVGQDEREEVSVIERGGNYGWRVWEADQRFRASGVAPHGPPLAPRHAYGHDQGRSITGGYVYRGRAIPALTGRYLFADFVVGKVWALAPDGRGPAEELGRVALPSSFGEGADGELYLTSFTGSIRKLVPRGAR
jgi:glucose/arabinose dehydrogenase